MSARLKTILALIFVIRAGPLAGQASGTTRPESLSAYLARAFDDLKLVGAGVGVIHSDGTTWSAGFGLADRERGAPATRETVALWASSSKVVTGLAILKAMRAKGIDLDEGINAYLPFKVANPAFPQTVITFRMLLVHTSSILFDRNTCSTLYVSGDAEMPLGEFLREYLQPGGRFYKPTNFSASAPGSRWAYSNIGFSLLGYLVERITGTPFNEYCKRELFLPLGMREASWFLKDLDSSRVAIQYESAQEPGPSRRVSQYGWPGFPDGMLRCSIDGMLRIMAALTDERSNGRHVVPRAIVAEMFTCQGVDPAQLKGRSPLVALDMGLVWRLIDLGGRRIWAHNGSGSGIATLILLDDKSKSAAAAWLTGGVLETPEGQAFFAALHYRLAAEMEQGGARD